MTVEKALEMIAPFSGLPYYDEAVTQIQLVSIVGKRELRETAYRIRDAFSAYDYAVNYGTPE